MYRVGPALTSLSPLGTVRAPFNAYGSSLLSMFYFAIPPVRPVVFSFIGITSNRITFLISLGLIQDSRRYITVLLCFLICGEHIWTVCSWVPPIIKSGHWWPSLPPFGTNHMILSSSLQQGVRFLASLIPTSRYLRLRESLAALYSFISDLSKLVNLVYANYFYLFLWETIGLTMFHY